MQFEKILRLAGTFSPVQSVFSMMNNIWFLEKKSNEQNNNKRTV